MTPERAKVLAIAECLMDYPSEATLDTMIRAILAACAEERREALTEAACLDGVVGNMTAHLAILALRDKEPR